MGAKAVWDKKLRKFVKPSQTKFKKLEKKVNTIAKAIEKNYKITPVAQAVSYDLNTANQLSILPFNGDGSTGTRQGRKVQPTSLLIRGQLRIDGSTVAESPSSVRMIVIQCNQRFEPQTNLNTASSRVLEGQGTTSTIFQHYDVNNRGHFTVLHDSVHALGYRNTAAGDSNGVIMKNIVLTLYPKKPIVYEDDSLVEERGGIYICLYSNTVSTQVEPVFNCSAKLNYMDF